MLRNLLFMTLCVLVPATYIGAAGEAQDIMTFPAKPGNVTFNHKKHVEGSRNCKTCHDRKGGKIKGLGKNWAHKVCKGCHDAIMMGPVTCEGCHGPPGTK